MSNTTSSEYRSGFRTGCAPGAPKSCSPLPGRPAPAGSSRRAFAAGPTRGPAARSRPKRIRWTRPRPGPFARASAPSATSSARCAARTGWRDWPFARRRFPVVGDGAGIWSLVHMTDVAAATLAALEHAPPGVYNIADDDPAPLARWLPAFAGALAAKPPRHVPAWLVRPFSQGAVVMANEIRGACNAKAKRQLGWKPAYPSWRDGFRNGLAQ